MAMTAVQPSTEKLLALGDEDFRNLVNDDLFRTPGEDPVADEQAELLRQPPLLDRWYWTLHSMVRKVEGQLATKDAEIEALKARTRPRHGDPQVRRQFFSQLEKAQEWRKKTLHFRVGLEQVYLVAKRLYEADERQRYERLIKDERWALARRVGELEDAIRRHRDAFPEDDDPSDTDLELWGLLPQD